MSTQKGIETFSRDLQLLKMFQFENVDSFHLKTVVSSYKEELQCTE